jgi:hypothetical protein
MKPMSVTAGHEVALVEEGPEVAVENERWFVFERGHRSADGQWHPGRGTIWTGATRAAGEAWAQDHGETIHTVEVYEP